MQVLSIVEICVNEKVRKIDAILDLALSANLIDFKKHLLTQSKLSSTQYDKYLLLIQTDKLKITYQESDEIIEQRPKYHEVYEAIADDVNLMHQIVQVVHQNRKLIFQLKRFTNQYLSVLDPSNSQTHTKRRLIKATKAKNVIEFDKDGQVVRDKLQVLQERPRYKIHPIESGYEYCYFCKTSSRDEELRVKCGPVYGPIRAGDKSIFLHELCALWTPEIFLDGKNKFKNLSKAIKRCKKIKCSCCKEKGGGLGCFVKSCDKSYHYLCAKVSNCLFVNSRFIIYCENHRNEAPEEYLEEEKIEEDQDDQLQHYICSICKSGLDEQVIMICEGCDKGFHSNCHQPPINIENIDEDEEWFCRDCQEEQNDRQQNDEMIINT